MDENSNKPYITCLNLFNHAFSHNTYLFNIVGKGPRPYTPKFLLLVFKNYSNRNVDICSYYVGVDEIKPNTQNNIHTYVKLTNVHKTIGSAITKNNCSEANNIDLIITKYSKTHQYIQIESKVLTQVYREKYNTYEINFSNFNSFTPDNALMRYNRFKTI